MIDLTERRQARAARRSGPRRPARVVLHFDLADPFSYLAAERIERRFGEVAWSPVTLGGLRPRDAEAERAAAQARASQLRMPLVWPERHPEPVPRAMRAASLAVECGRGAAFALAAGRLAFCGGFDLDDPEILAEAAAAAGLGLDACLRAAGDPGRDAVMLETGRGLVRAGADRLPAVQVGRALFTGEDRVAEAAAAARLAAVN